MKATLHDTEVKAKLSRDPYMEESYTGEPPDKPNRPRVIMGGHPIVEWLKQAGIPTERVTRVVIDLRIAQPVRIYIEQLGSEKMLKPSLTLALRGAEVWIDGKQKH